MKSRWIVRSVAVLIFTFAGGGIAAERMIESSSCPKRPFEEIRVEYKPAPLKPGEVVIDRALFWERMGKIAKEREIFRYKVKRKSKATGMISIMEKTVSFDKSIVDNEHKAVVEAIFDYWEAAGGGHPKHLALMLGTAYRETCGSLLSTVGEACGCSKTCSKDEYESASYGKKDSCGRAYFGRGLVQITHYKTYKLVGGKLSIPLDKYPELAYEQSFAIMMLIDGVKKRWYAGKPLSTYLDDERSDWVRARESVSPGSPNKAATGYLACRFYDAIQPAYKKPAPVQDSASCMRLENF